MSTPGEPEFAHNPRNQIRKLNRHDVVPGQKATLEWNGVEHQVQVVQVVEHPHYGKLVDVKYKNGQKRRVVGQLVTKAKS